MNLNLGGKTALITASSDGLGFAAALELAVEGAEIVLCSRDSGKLKAAAERIQEASGKLPAQARVDLRDHKSVEDFIATLKESGTVIDILVYNVGGPEPGSFRTLGDAAWDASYMDNIVSYRVVLKGVLPGMVERGWGRVIAIASISAKQSLEGLTISNVFRPAIVGLTKTLSQEYGTSGITFNTVCPGGIFTTRIEQVLSRRAKDMGKSTAELSARYVADIPMKRFGKPEEVAAAIAFLASERASFINGVSLSIDGGLTRMIN